MLLEIKRLNQRFGENDILKEINLEIKQGETFVIIGPTGSGKTTLLRLIGLLDKPVSGVVYFKGQEIPASGRAKITLRRRMAMVSQKPAVFNTSVYNNVAYGLKIRGTRGADLHDRVADAIYTVGLSGYEKRNARTLSGGETQRVALARAMVTEPELLLLDEPTANLDPVSTSNVEKIIAQIIRKLDTTVVMTTHDMFQGQRLADRIGVIVGGEMKQTGIPREIFGLPQSRDIAEFVGMENILEGTISANDGGIISIAVDGAEIQAISDLDPGVAVYACIRPEEIVLARKTDKTSARNTFATEITRIVSFGPLAHIHMDCGFSLVALITVKSAEEMGLQIGTPIYASFKATGVHIIVR